METLKLPVFGIEISYEPNDKRGASITSNMKELPETDENEMYNAAIDGIESLILSLFCAGVDVNTTQFLEGIETSYNALGHQFS